jgi:RNA polymerase sigma factor for flagellar operon FliA
MATPPNSIATPPQRAPDSPEILARFQEQLELVEILSRQVARAIGPAVELDDLRSFGREGLLDAARKFDATRGVPFRGYANFRVRGAIYDGVRSLAQLPRRVYERLNGLSASLRVSEGAADDSYGSDASATRAQADQALGDHLAAMATAMAVGLVAKTATGEEGEQVQVAQSDNPEEAVSRAQLLTLIEQAIAGLPEDEATLVRRHYLEGERFDHVAESLGLSKSWASRLHTRAMQRLSKRLRSST